MNYITTNGYGRIVRYFTMTDVDVVKYTPRDDEFEVDDLPHEIMHSPVFFIGNKFIVMPPAPSPNHVVDDKTRTWVLDLDKAAEAARQQRSRLLAQSDWTQMPDVPLETKALWAEYRQALRDITSQPGFPENITWPEPPK